MSDEELISLIGRRVRKLRLDRGMTQEDLAAKCNFDQPNIARIESGATGPTIKSLNRISNALEIDIIELFRFDDLALNKL